MLFFRSEEHLKNWELYKPENKEGIISLEDLVKMFSGNYFKKRLDPDYVSNMGRYAKEMIADLENLKDAGAFFKL